ncbi:MAG: hypothetical protein ABI120_16690 [Gemmatimonadaceae bacterium]
MFGADADTFKRMCGAYGNRPADVVSNTPRYTGTGSPQFNTVHGICVSRDRHVYVADRLNNSYADFFARWKIQGRRVQKFVHH